MTEKQFNEALRINERMKDFVKLKGSLNPFNSLDKVKLSYTAKCKYGGEEHERIIDESYIISDILSRHDKQIRQEIDEEIAKLKKEIEAL